MTRIVVGAGVVTLGVALAVLVAAQTKEPLVERSVEGVLDHILPEEGRLFLKANDGQRLDWQLPAGVIAEAAKAGVGSRVWVVYRKLDAADRAVTALGFPGMAHEPVYLNASGFPVVLRTGPAVDGKCGAKSAAASLDQNLGPGIATEDRSACWCCAPEGQTCTPSNRSAKGRIVLAQCFASGPGT